MNNSIIIIFGATGDLSQRKLIPSLYALFKKGLLRGATIIGVALEDISAITLLDRSRAHIKDFDEAIWEQLCASFSYQSINFVEYAGYLLLLEHIQTIETQRGFLGNRLVYLAAAAYFFCPITEYIGKLGIVHKNHANTPAWHRIVYEKPFGSDLQSAHAINACIARWFDENQVYRVDHYLTKELVSNIALLRFTNIVFEPLWNSTYIDHIQIVLSETMSVGDRATYYDQYGALRDVVQNHMLELLALIAMEAPAQLSGDFIRAERVKALQAVRVVDGVLGQYSTYRQENLVRVNSQTETFAVLCLHVDNKRWQGVPFYLKTGKCLDKQEVVIHIKFRPVVCLLTKNCPSESNWLTIRIAPDALFTLHMNAKKPGRSDELMTFDMSFCHSCIFGMMTPGAYQVLLEDILAGEQATSVRFDEIEAAWRIIDQVYHKKFPLYFYEVGTAGPREMEEFCIKHAMRWRL